MIDNIVLDARQDLRLTLKMPVASQSVIAFALAAQKESAPKAPNRIALANDNAMAMLFLMDADKNGKISKQEWMSFMSAEFDRLDVNRRGELEPKKFDRSRMSLRPVRIPGTGK